jgi:hypothetical protein
MFNHKHLYLIMIFVLAFLLITGSVWWSLEIERSSLAHTVADIPTAALPVNPNSDIPYLNVPRVSLKEAKTAFDLGKAVFVDARSSNSYAEGHIPGAKLWDEADLPGFVSNMDLSTWIITYCT